MELNKKNYAWYEQNFKRFMEDRGLTNLSHESGEHGDHHCTCCGKHVGYNEGHFYAWGCDCCGSWQGGTLLFHANGWSEKHKEAMCFRACADCLYYAEYGRLDDQTMLDIEEGDNE